MKSTQLLGVHFLRLVCLGLCTAWAAPALLLAQNVAEEPVVTQLKVFWLKYAPAVEVMQNIRSVQQGQADGVVQLATDSRTNSLIARAPQEVLEEIEALVKILDTETPDERRWRIADPPGLAGRRVSRRCGCHPAGGPGERDSGTGEDGCHESDDGGAVGGQCHRGREVQCQRHGQGQRTVYAAVRGTSRWQVARTELPAGTSADESWLRLEISANVTGGEPMQPLCKLQTTVKAPIGQSVVLGVTPVQSKPSVFVLQLRRPATSDN